jgi:glycine/D-amino acid oxidase-like deaminating enzyme/nitrite reductase/ring-hydroxylating ferredoxin subunit
MVLPLKTLVSMRSCTKRRKLPFAPTAALSNAQSNFGAERQTARAAQEHELANLDRRRPHGERPVAFRLRESASDDRLSGLSDSSRDPAMFTRSPWAEVNQPKYPHVEQCGRYDVVIVGGGMTGLSAALLLKEAGRTVCVLERDRIGSGDTGRTSGHLTFVTDVRLSNLVKTFSKEVAQRVWLGGAAALSTLRQIVDRLRIDCQFQLVPAYLCAKLEGGGDDEREELREEAELMRELDFGAAFLERAPLVDRPGVRIPNQGKFHPLEYLGALASVVDGDGSRVFEQSNVDEFDDDAHAAVVGKHKIACDYVIIATHVPLMGKAGLVGATVLQTKLASYTSYVVGGTIPAGQRRESLYWDTAEPYHFLRIDAQRGYDYVIFGGEDHKTGQESDTEERFARLERTLSTVVPGVQITHRWSGQIVETNDGLPYIGETAERQFALTGCAGNGLTYSVLGALMARDRVLGRDNPWSDVFSVTRTKIRGALGNYIRENLDFPAYILRDWLVGPESDSVDDLAPGEGKILSIDGKRVACARDHKGRVLRVSPVCTHMGCLVRWNAAEQTWDCPCHGSRFQPDGSVVAGPAESPLESAACVRSENVHPSRDAHSRDQRHS